MNQQTNTDSNDWLSEILDSFHYGEAHGSCGKQGGRWPKPCDCGIDEAKQQIQSKVDEMVRLAVEKARSKDPHKCEYGHSVYSHNTADGWCCACDADIAFLNAQLSTNKSKRE